MAKKKPTTKVFDPVAFGESLREKRRGAGFSNVKKLSEAIEKDTGEYIDPDTLHRIERGEREPNISKLEAICITIFGNDWLRELVNILKSSLPATPYGVSLLSKAAIQDIEELDTMQEVIRLKKIAAISKTLDIKFSDAESLYNEPELRKKFDEVFSNNPAR